MRLRMAVPLLFMLGGAPADPDFTGMWKLKEERRESGSIPQPAALMTIEREAEVLGITETGGDGAQVTWFVSADRKERKSAARGVTMRSVGKWEGDALLINTIVSGPKGDYTIMDRWLLSRGGAVLTIRREVVRRAGAAESVLTYEKAR